jgi:hypothetical protein
LGRFLTKDSHAVSILRFSLSTGIRIFSVEMWDPFLKVYHYIDETNNIRITPNTV